MEEGEDQTPTSDSKDYNTVLEYYVDDPDAGLDLVGLIAYALYKRHKRDWITKHRLSHSGTKPSNEQVEAVVDSYLTSEMRSTLRERASDILSSYAETYVEAVEPEIKAQAVNNETLRQAREIERSIVENSGLWRQVGTGLISTAIWSLVVTVLVLAALFFGSDILNLWNQLSNIH
ncbi:MAG: hypothetical protein ACTHJ3_10425 [Pararhizobium sp.]